MGWHGTEWQGDLGRPGATSGRGGAAVAGGVRLAYPGGVSSRAARRAARDPSTHPTTAPPTSTPAATGTNAGSAPDVALPTGRAPRANATDERDRTNTAWRARPNPVTPHPYGDRHGPRVRRRSSYQRAHLAGRGATALGDPPHGPSGRDHRALAVSRLQHADAPAPSARARQGLLQQRMPPARLPMATTRASGAGGRAGTATVP